MNYFVLLSKKCLYNLFKYPLQYQNRIKEKTISKGRYNNLEYQLGQKISRVIKIRQIEKKKKL